MESLESLEKRLKQTEKNLERITKNPNSNIPYTDDGYADDKYIDRFLAASLISTIESLKEQIDTYPNREEIERKQRESKNPTYEYTAGGEKETTNNPAMSARYDAQHRFFEMGKMRKAFTKINGQYKKFGKLWDQALESDNEKEQQEIAQQLNKLFR